MSARPGRRGRIQLVALAALFFVPFVTAIVVTGFFPQWLPEGTVNNGRLLKPLVSVTASGLSSLDSEAIEAGFLHGKWTIVQIAEPPCAQPCRERLYQSQQVRLALSKDARRVQRLLVLSRTGAEQDLPRALGEAFPGLRVARADQGWRDSFAIDGVGPSTGTRLFLIDPQGYLMMLYEPEIEPQSMLKDLKRLMKTSRAG